MTSHKNRFLKLKSDLESLGYEGILEAGKLLAPFVYYKIGGPAEIFADPKSEKDLALLAKCSIQLSIPVTILGSGTNLLVSSKGINGIVVSQGAREDPIQIIDEDSTSITVQMSARTSKFNALKWSLEQGLEGLEFSAGIPGTLGGAVYMNAGTKWGSYSEVISKVRFFNLKSGFYEKTSAELGFKYRGHAEGIFKDTTFVLSLELKLKKTTSETGSLDKIDEILAYRGSKQPLEFPSCGSVFKNPLHSEKGAGRLIESCGLKGKKIGEAQISQKHSNFILNLGNASSDDVLAIIRLAQEQVKKTHNIDLETEVICL